MRNAWVMLLPLVCSAHFGDSVEFGVLMNEDGEPLPSLEGTWRDEVGSEYVMRRIQPMHLAAVAPNSTYSLDCNGKPCGQCRLKGTYDFETRARTALAVTCDGFAAGAYAEDSKITWPGDGAWSFEAKAASKASEVHTVHMIYMNHYDVGYTGFVNSVDNGYMHKYFKSAAETAEAMRQANSSDKFIYITHPWLVQRFLQCPCPSQRPTPPVPALNLEGVWTTNTSVERFYFSLVGADQYGVRCLTGNWTDDEAAGKCSVSSASCSAEPAANATLLQCSMPDGSKQEFPISNDGKTVGPWRRFVGKVSGLWYGPGDDDDFYIMTHNDTTGELTVWWDKNVSAMSAWRRGSGQISGSNVTLLIPDFSGTPLKGTLQDNKDRISWVLSAGEWNRHLSSCYPAEPACMEHSCLARDLGNTLQAPLTCPTAEEVASFETAVGKGDISWHAGPFNIQPENMAPELFDAGIAITRRLDERYYGSGKISQTLNLRDLIYSTRSILPLLRKHNITGLTIGSNGANFPPQVPKLHRWLDPATGADVVVAYHPYGYGGYGAGDCAESPNGFALCTEFRTDNTGPPGNVKEVTDSLNSVRKLYPGASVKTSTFDAFIKDVLPAKEQLPVVSLEVGDTWVYGNPSDPLKMAVNRAVQREWVACLSNSEAACSLENPAIQNMTWWLLKAPEHTWGSPGIAGWGGGDDYNVTHFRSELGTTAYMHAAASWAEQSMYNEIAIRALEEAEHPLAARARAAATALESVERPDLLAYTKAADRRAPVQLGDGAHSIRLAFSESGAISTLEIGGVDWASDDATLAAFVYQTLSDQEWKPFTYAYCNDHKEQAGFCKPGSQNFTESKIWRPSLAELWLRGTHGVVARLLMPSTAASFYGAPEELYLNVSLSFSAGASWALDITLVTIGKKPTMVGEAQMLTFQPAPALRAPKPSPSNASDWTSAWTLSKLGGTVDPEGVIDGGSQYTHGTWGPATVETAEGHRLSINSLDAPNMNPMTAGFPIGNPLPASYNQTQVTAGEGLSRLQRGSVFGMGINLHNNLWNTNYPLYYPFFDARYCKDAMSCRNANLMFRFQLSASQEPETLHV